MEKYMHWKQFFTPTRSMNSEEAKQLLRANELTDVQIVDVRQPAEYNNDHIAGAILIPLPELSDSYNLLQKDKPILVY
jgi:rhodanese-related sulfurtransferase